jgi:hypothetical protein
MILRSKNMNYLLIVIGIFLIIVNLRGLFNKKIDFNRIFKVKAKEENAGDLQILDLRKEFSEKILDLEMEISRINERLNEREDKDIKKAMEVKKLIDEGLTVEMISEKLKTSREEIILLKDLY